MGLRKDFLVHKRKTVESFELVKADISSLNASIGNLGNTLALLDSRVNILSNEASLMRAAIDESRITYHNALSRIEDIRNSVDSIAATISSFKNIISKTLSKNGEMSREIAGSRNAIKKLFSISRIQSSRNKQLNSALRKSQAEIRKVKNLLNRRLTAVNRRIEGVKSARKPSRRIIKKRIAPRKIIKKTITPKRIVTETITPKRKKIVKVVKSARNPLF